VRCRSQPRFCLPRGGPGAAKAHFLTMSSSRLCRLVTAAASVLSLATAVAPACAAAARETGAAPSPGAQASAASDREMSAIVHTWSRRLDAGDYAGIAELFALPALIVQEPYAYRLTTRHQVALWHSLLPCSGTVLSITYRGRFATAVFLLGNRHGVACDQPGGLAAARFEIVAGKIRSWVQVPVPSHSQSGPVA
jgi:hypothetical protein